MKAFPGQGIAHRSDRANEVARNTEKNKHLNGGIPGGEHGAVNSNAGGNGNAAGTSNNPGSSGGTGGGNSGGGNSGGVGGGNGSGGSTGGGAGQGNGREFIFFYHPDHLGSTGYVTDEKALRYEHITYFPFGETWVQESNATWRVPYQFTSKEMDQETGLYYFGARYYDPRTSVWQSADPILERYLPTGDPEKDKNLPGMSGVFNSFNLNLNAYGHQNPVKFVDPDGRVVVQALAFIAAVTTRVILWVAPRQAAITTAVETGAAITTGAVVPSVAVEVAAAKVASTVAAGAAKGGTETVQRAMSRVELESIQSSGLLSRGGRAGDHFVSDAVNSAAGRTQQRLALPGTPQVRATLEVPSNVFSIPSKVAPKYNMPGGGMERTAPGNIDIPAKVLEVLPY